MAGSAISTASSAFWNCAPPVISAQRISSSTGRDSNQISAPPHAPETWCTTYIQDRKTSGFCRQRDSAPRLPARETRSGDDQTTQVIFGEAEYLKSTIAFSSPSKSASLKARPRRYGEQSGELEVHIRRNPFRGRSKKTARRRPYSQNICMKKLADFQKTFFSSSRIRQ